jgi:predicted amidohydrolase
LAGLKVGFVQMRPVFGERARNVERSIELMRMGSADLWVLPELANTGYNFTSPREAASLGEPVPEGPSSRRWIDFARTSRSCLVAGIAELSGGKLYNSALVAAADGRTWVYRKVHLYSAENRWFVPGDGPPRVIDLGPVRLGVIVCFDWFFPEMARSLALTGADVLAHPANLILPWGQRAMVTRAVENGVYAVTANRVGTESRGGSSLTFTGASQVISPKGETLAQASVGDEEIGVAEVDPATARDKRLNEFNDLFAGRRPEHYLRLGERRD